MRWNPCEEKRSGGASVKRSGEGLGSDGTHKMMRRDVEGRGFPVLGNYKYLPRWAGPSHKKVCT